MEGLPVGFRFHPTERELVGYFLRNRASYGSEFRPGSVADCPDFFGKTEPWVIWDSHGGPGLEEGESLYFFTQRHKLGGAGARFNRKVGSGTWSAQRPVNVKEKNGEVIGKKREFRYERGSNSDQNDCWLMQEFEMDVNDSLVLCTLRKAPPKPTVEVQSKKKMTGKRNEKCGDNDGNDSKRLRLEQPAISNNTAEVVNVSNNSDFDNDFTQWLKVTLAEDSNIGDATLDECLGEGTSGLPFIDDPSLFDLTNDANADFWLK